MHLILEDQFEDGPSSDSSKQLSESKNFINFFRDVMLS